VISVVHFERKAGPRGFSIERLFADLRAAMPSDIRCVSHTAPFRSRGILPRLGNIWDARRYQGKINHITGDVHFLSLGLPRENTILTVHDCGMLHRLRGWKRALMKLLWFSWPIAHCHIVTAVSEATKLELIEFVGAPPDKIRVIHDCISPKFVPEPSIFNSSKPRILMIGTSPNKNLERMATALAGIPCDAEIVGDPSREQKAAFAAHGVSLSILGDLSEPEIHAAYRRCDVLLFASTHEGFGLPILEAQAIGRPVVTGDCSSMPEVAGTGACLVDPFDPAAIRRGLESVIGDFDYRAELLRNGYLNVRRFPATHVAEQYAQVYRELSAETSPS
jgi:glycosyltransferase involved in cell wall biosynthesis